MRSTGVPSVERMRQGVLKEERCRLNCTDPTQSPENPLLLLEELCIWTETGSVCHWILKPKDPHSMSPTHSRSPETPLGEETIPPGLGTEDQESLPVNWLGLEFGWWTRLIPVVPKADFFTSLSTETSVSSLVTGVDYHRSEVQLCSD